MSDFQQLEDTCRFERTSHGDHCYHPQGRAPLFLQREVGEYIHVQYHAIVQAWGLMLAQSVLPDFPRGVDLIQVLHIFFLIIDASWALVFLL